VWSSLTSRRRGDLREAAADATALFLYFFLPLTLTNKALGAIVMSRARLSTSPPPHAPIASTSTSFSFSASGNRLSTKASITRGKKTSARGGITTNPSDLSSTSLSHEQVEGLRRQSHLSTLSLSPRRPSTAASGSTATTRPRRTSQLGYEGDESSFVQRDGLDEEEQGETYTSVDRMRNWRNDAMTQHLYSTAEFWGGKVFGLTGMSASVKR
jgi:hypothetical protein